MWASPRELGSGGPALASLGSSTVAILAGFCLTSAVSTGRNSGSPSQIAAGAFGLGAIAFVLSLAFIATAEDYAATPDLRLAYNPEARVSEKELTDQRALQRQDQIILAMYSKRVNAAVIAGITGTLIGLSLAMLADRLSAVSVIVAVVAGMVLLALVGDYIWTVNWWLFPRPVRAEMEAGPAGSRRQRRTERRDFQNDLLHQPAARGPLGQAGLTAMFGESWRAALCDPVMPRNVEDLLEIADAEGVGDLFRDVCERMSAYFDGVYADGPSIVFTAAVEGRHTRILALHALSSSSTNGVKFDVVVPRLATLWRVSQEKALSALPLLQANTTPRTSSTHHGFFRSTDQLHSFSS